jgi:hypothetical protein
MAKTYLGSVSFCGIADSLSSKINKWASKTRWFAGLCEITKFKNQSSKNVHRGK